jgi:apolipoprotein N-acyltransferase
MTSNGLSIFPKRIHATFIIYLPQLLCTVSALLYAISFIALDYCWWCIFLSFALLWYAFTISTHPFRDGCWWGYIAFGSILAGVVIPLYHFLAAQPTIALAVPSLVISYFSCLGGLWIWCISCMHLVLIKRYRLLPIIVVPLISALFFHFITCTSLWMAEPVQGCCFLNPLLPLVCWQPVRLILPYAGTLITLVLFFAVTFLPTQWRYLSVKERIGVIMGCIGICSFYLVSNKDLPYPAHDHFEHLAILPILCKTDNPRLLAHMLYTHYTKHPNYTDITYLLLPESALIVSSPEILKEAIAHFYTYAHTTHIHLICGTLISNDSYTFNSCYWAHNGTVQERYHKQHAVPLIEQLPRWLKHLVSYQTLFPQDQEMVIPPDHPRPSFSLSNTLVMIPYICSEFFCTYTAGSKSDNIITLALCNDMWTQFDYIKRLMCALAHAKATEYQQDVLYVAYHYAAYCYKNGLVDIL